MESIFEVEKEQSDTRGTHMYRNQINQVDWLIYASVI